MSYEIELWIVTRLAFLPRLFLGAHWRKSMSGLELPGQLLFFQSRSPLAFISPYFTLLVPGSSHHGLWVDFYRIPCSSALFIGLFVHIVSWQCLLVFSWGQASRCSVHVMMLSSPYAWLSALPMPRAGCRAGCWGTGMRKMCSLFSGSLYWKYLELPGDQS